MAAACAPQVPSLPADSEVATGGQLAGVRTQPVVPGRPGRVFVFAGVDETCKSLAAPTLSVTQAPAKGEITFRPGQATTIATSGGACQGTQAIGTGVYFTAREGTSGGDRFSVTATLATGETMTRDFQVEIAE